MASRSALVTTDASTDSPLITAQILRRGVGDGGRDRRLATTILEIGRLGGVGTEADLDQYRRHECGYENAKSRLLHAAIRTRMHRRQMLLHELRQFRRLPQVLVL